MDRTRRQVLRLGGAALVGGLAGCLGGNGDDPTDSPSPTPGDGGATAEPTPTRSATANDSPAPTPESTPTPGPQEGDDGTVATRTTQSGVDWRFDLGAEVRATPAVADGVLYVGGWRETYGTPTPGGDPRGPSTALRGIGLADGDERLRVEFGAPIQRRLRVVDDRVYVVRGFWGVYGHDFQVRAVSTDGRELWRHHAQSRKGLRTVAADASGVVGGEEDDHLCNGGEETVALAADGSVRWRRETTDVFDGTADADATYVTDHCGRAFAFDRASGDQRWVVERAETVRQPTLVDGALVAAGAVPFAVDRATGDVRWTFDDGPTDWAVLDGGGRDSLPTADGLAFVPTEDGRLVALDAADGRLAWDVDREPRTSYAVDDGTVYVSPGDGTVAAHDASDGGRLWETTVGGHTGLQVAQDRVYVLRGGEVTALAAGDGRERGSVTVEGEPRWVLAGGGRTAAVTAQGLVYGLAL